MRAAVLMRDGGRCRWCGALATDVDHKEPLAAGGAPFDLRNLVASCEGCNSRRGGMTRAQTRHPAGSSLAAGSGFLRVDMAQDT